MKRVILPILFLLIIAGVPTAASAITIQVSVDNVPCPAAGFTFTTVTPVAPVLARTQFFGTCGDISINTIPGDPAGTLPEVSAELSGSTVVLVFRKAAIKNTSSLTTHTVTITYSHFYNGLNVNTTRYWGISMTGNFCMPDPALTDPNNCNLLASGARLQSTSTVAITRQTTTQTTTKIEPVGGSIGTGVTVKYPKPDPACPDPCSLGTFPYDGDPNFNFFTPQNPVQVTERIDCARLFGGATNCLTGATNEKVVTVFLGARQSIQTRGSFDDFGTLTPAQLVALLSAHTATIDIKPGESENFVQPNKEGTVHVALLGGNGSTQSCFTSSKKKGRGTVTECVTIPPFDVTEVVLETLVFGPACPTGYKFPPIDASGNPTGGAGCRAVVKHSSCSDTNNDGILDGCLDLNGDGVPDLGLQFDNTFIGWNTNCSPLQTTGTLVGFLLDETGFNATQPVTCQPPPNP
jgi:hypothetical protein